ncbi:3'-5' exonuclease [Pseudolactococcus paracarnosus]|uniref:3'-5' exonuclease n=1 Tax=Pseudolactococcus paracarnosus TaxID=2749962 RepID=A0A7L4WEH4_9LACT|nr:3'-5' exonuclease [Lactococcus paracarnosus]SPC36102.1 DNA polymerase III alpha subunit DNA polymerase III epsilon chain [Lactococcus piscium]MCJ1976969.1 3'-5' exonuclease [Lactococcus paracarnosus]MCJ1983380.1 3'-5' exonuclease [Lactococcus paracarnosus]MCJ1993655.1 3'-5' exonuclease [Lactococcus paracarnosus]MCJ1998756.1 3'-5' exonuclease [Lactococcus paracarnosus]
MKILEKYVAFDVEFNTVDEVEHLIQVSAVSFENGIEVDAFDSYIYSDVPVNSFVVGLTGITQEKVLTAPKASEALSKLNRFIADLPVIGYNSHKSDLPILLENGLDLTPLYALDVYEVADSMRDNKLHGIKNFQLKSLAEFFGVAEKNAHNALADARMTARVYEAMKDTQDAEKLLAKQNEKSVTDEDNPFAGLAGLF